MIGHCKIGPSLNTCSYHRYAPFLTVKRKLTFGPKVNFSSTDETAKLQMTDNTKMDKLDDLISQYQMFHDAWIENLKRLRDQNNGNKCSLNDTE